MKLSTVLLFTAVALGVSAAPQVHRRQANLNQGSDRLITQGANGTFDVDGIEFDDSSVASQVACALDERDCKANGGSADQCKQGKIDCQSGNGLNGQSAKLNNEQP